MSHDDRYPLLVSGYKKFLHGGDYNPDQWLQHPEVIDEDFRLMPLAGCNTFSLGIFAWTALEPEEGRYEITWLDRLMDRMAAAGNKVILATPSGAKPAWLGIKYEQTRRMDRAGHREAWGFRHNHCMTSPIYREKAANINRKLAERYAKHPALGMWHIGNEFNGECHCPLCYEAFRGWIKDKFRTLDAVNEAFWLRFWSHAFTDWSQVTPQDRSFDGLQVEWLRFVTHQTTDFLKTEIAAVREFSKETPVTTNLMGPFEGVDYWRLCEPLSLVTNDSYPILQDRSDNVRTAAGVAFSHDLLRSIAGGRPWMLMESAPSATNWVPVARLKRPGAHRLEMMQSVAHGADGTCYFQWRKGRGGCEKYHGSVVDHEGSEKPRVFQEVAAWGRTLNALAPVLGARVKADAAVVYDWECRWALRTSQGPGRADGDTKQYLPTVQAHHRAFWNMNIPVDVIERRSDFSRYKLLVCPMLYLVDGDLPARLRQFVERGGTLVATYLSGVVDHTNRCHLGGWPGAGLRELFGVWAEEIDNLHDDDEQNVLWKPDNALGLSETYKANAYCDVLHVEGAEVAATFGQQFYAGRPAVTVRRWGKGQAWYVASRNSDEFHTDFLGRLAAAAGIRPALEANVPAGVSVQARHAGSKTWWFAMNFTRQPQVLPLSADSWRDVETGEAIGSSLHLRSDECRVLERA